MDSRASEIKEIAGNELQVSDVGTVAVSGSIPAAGFSDSDFT